MPETKKRSYGHVNGYICPSCGCVTWTKDVDEGVTPFLFRCRATLDCTGLATSMCYRVPPDLNQDIIVIEWYRPTEEQARDEDRVHRGLMDHFKNGGLFWRWRQVITDVFVFHNGMVVVCDQHGQQIPMYQGKWDEKKRLIMERKPESVEVKFQ